MSEETKEIDWLTHPMQPHELEFRVGIVKYVDPKTKQQVKSISVLTYVTNRAVMDRLDKCYPKGWQTDFREWRNKGTFCNIGTTQDGKDYQWRGDGADETNIEATKGGFSDAMKRAAVHWIPALRRLYDYPNVTIQTNSKYIPSWAKPRLKAMVNAINEDKVQAEFINLTQS